MVSPGTDRGVAETEAALPSLPERFVPRGRLRARVEEATGDAALTTLRAPAGTGKTVLLTEWARTTPATTAWVTVDPADNRPGRLWTAVARAVAGRVPALVPGLRRRAPGDPGPESGPGPLLAALDALPVALHLVLDDLHELSDPARLDELRTLIRYRPDRLRLVMVGRTLPALPWPRLRLQGGVADLDGHDLAFSAGEAASLLSRYGVRMSATDLAGVHATTGGWAAALGLAAAAARRSADGASSPATHAEVRHAIATYLDEQVLGLLPDGDRSLLRDLAVHDVVSPGLAGDLSGRPDAVPVLERLAHRTSLVDADPHTGGFRIHPVLRSSVDDARRRHLHARAARWCATRGRPDEALRHACSAGDEGLLRELIGAWALPLLLDGEHEVLRRACDALAPGAGGTDRTTRLVRAALDEEPPAPETSLGEGDLGALRTLADLGAIEHTDPDDGPSRRVRADAAAAVDAVLDGATKLVVLDDPAAASRVLADAATRSRDLGHHHLALRCTALLAAACAALGDAAGMARHGADAVAMAARGGWETSAWTVSARVTSAHGSLLRARSADAGRQATLSGDEALHPASSFLLGVVRGAALADSGHLARGLTEMQRTRTGLSDRRVPVREAAAAAVLEHEAALRLDRLPHARAVRRWLDGRAGPTGERLLMTVRETVHADASAPVARRLRPLLDGAVPALLPGTEVEALLRAADEAQLAGHGAQARALVMAALGRAAPLDLIRPFTHTSTAVRELMAYQVGSFGTTDPFARRALASGRREPAAMCGVVLSDRESTVLHLLTSLATTTEIAEDLHVSLNTVKTQVAAIYGKLGVTDRRAAVALAYDAGLLDDITRSG